MLASLPGAPLPAALLAQLQPVAFAPGEHLFHAGDAGDGCYLIDTGTVVLHADQLGATRLLGPGELVDVAGLLRGRERGTDAYAPTAVGARLLPADALTAVCRTRPDALPAICVRLERVVAGGTWQQTTNAAVQDATELVAHGASAQAIVARWSEPSRVDLMRDLATQVAERAEHLAASAVAEAGAGDLAAETRANRQASLGLFEALAQRPLTTPVGSAATAQARTTSELCFVPQQYPIATAVAAILLALEAGRALILSCEQATHARCRHVQRLIAGVLMGHGAPHALVQWVAWGTGEETALGLMASGGSVVLLGDRVNRDKEQENKP